MKKILYIVSTLKNSGPNNQLYNLIKHLHRSQFEPHLITLSPEPPDSRWKDYQVMGVQLYTLELSRIQGLLFAKKQLQYLVQQIEPDIIHTQGIRADVLSATLNVSVPKIATIHNFPQQDYAMTYGRLQAKLMLWQHVQAMRRLDICVAVSKAVADSLGATFGIKNTVAIPNGVDTAIYKCLELNEKRIIRQKLNLKQDAEICISAGQLSKRKNPLLIIASWKEAFGKDSTKQLVFIGDGSKKAECEKAISGFPNIHIAGKVSNVSDFLNASDFFVSASKAEGLPNTVIEALSCGLPVFLSDIAPHREIWEMSPMIGILFSLSDHKALTNLLVNWRERNKDEMSKAAIDLTNDKLSAQKMSERYQHIYANLNKYPPPALPGDSRSLTVPGEYGSLAF